MPNPDFCTVSQVKELLPINSRIKDDDPVIQREVTAWSESARMFIGDAMNAADYSEAYSGTGTGKLVLRHQPITAVASVSIGLPGRRSALVFETDYVFTRFGLQMLVGVFPRGVQNVLVNYTAGYAAIPADLSRAVAKLVALKFKENERLGQSSKTLAGETVTFDLKAFPNDVREVFERYERVAQVEPG